MHALTALPAGLLMTKSALLEVSWKDPSTDARTPNAVPLIVRSAGLEDKWKSPRTVARAPNAVPLIVRSAGLLVSWNPVESHGGQRPVRRRCW